MSRLPPSAAVTFDASGRPVSSVFQDFYFASAGDAGESDAVFLRGAGLPERWRDRRVFTVGEIGFGAGVNILALWDAWRRHRPAGGVLHVLSLEGFPLSRADAARALAGYTRLAPLAERLLARWPVRARGLQRLWFAEDGFCLTLLQDDVAGLEALDLAADAWFLDGFAPSRNPELWSPAVFAALRRLSQPGARVATYSVAGAVRRGLASAGFEVARAPGFGPKRERLEARLPGVPAPDPRPRSALVVGAGIAGASAACALLRRGLSVTIVDARARLADGASGNPAGLVSPRLDLTDTPAQRFLRAAFLFARDTYRDVAPHAYAETGISQVVADPARAARLLADPPLPDDVLRPGVAGDMLELGLGGVLRPRDAVEAMCRGAHVLLAHPVDRLAREDGPPGLAAWRAFDPGGACVWSGDLVVLAGGPACDRLAQGAFLPIERRQGQISWARPGPALSRPITGGAYALADGNALMFGATFDPVGAEADFAALAPSDADHARNRAALTALAPKLAAELAAAIGPAPLAGRTSVRAGLRDRLPAAGVLAQGLGVVTGLGARGLTTGPLAAEAVVSDLLGEPSPLDRGARRAVDPNRFRSAAHPPPAGV